MHLWPSLAIRDSFKVSNLRNFEWNHNRMKREAQIRSYQEKLLSNQVDGVDGSNSAKSTSGFFATTVLVLSCCFCCAASDDE